MKRVTLFSVALAFCLGSASKVFAQSLMVLDFASSPSANSKVSISQGRKGLRVLMQYAGPGPGLPINASSASVTVTANGAAHTCTFNVVAPASKGDCGFIAAPFDTTSGLHPLADTVVIYVNDDFNVNSSVTESVSGVKAADGTLSTPGSIMFIAGDPADPSKNTPRATVSSELVFDISGSMGLPIAASSDPSAERRIDALKDAARELYLLLGQYAAVGDRVGQSFFSTSVTPGGGVLKPANDPSQLTALQNDLLMKEPTNSTAIGLGLLAGQAGLAGDSNTQQYIFLFSDGEQNVSPFVANPVPASGIAIGPATLPTSIKVCTITMGTQTAAGFSLQDQMNAVSCPHKQSLYVNASQPTFAKDDLETYFVNEILTALVGDKLEIVRDVSGTLGSTVVTQSFPANPRDANMTILVSWDGGRGGRPELSLTAPDGTAIDLTHAASIGISQGVIRLDFPFKQGAATINPAGVWQLGLRAGIIDPESTKTEHYHLMVINDNASLGTDASLDIQDPGTGDPIPITVQVHDGTTAVTGASVVAILLGPDNGLGDILAKAADPSGTPGSTGDIIGSAAQAKLALLLNDPAFIAMLQNHNLPVVALSDSGHLGTYMGTFTGALKEGHYQFLIAIAGTSAANGAFERARKLTVFVRPKPDAGHTDFTMVSRQIEANGSVLVHLRAVPRDRFGSFLGPDYLPFLAINCTPCSVATPIADDLHGAYDVTYRLASASVNPTVGLTILGQTVAQSPLSALGPPTAYGSGPFAISFQLGGTFAPSGGLSGASGSFSAGGGFEFRRPTGFSFETWLGYDRFSTVAGNEHIVNLSERLRYTAGTARPRPFAFFGLGGSFARGPVDTNSASLDVGSGLQYWIKRRLAAEAVYTFHDLFSFAGTNARYSTGTAGLRWVF
jgi:hypothetical protein